MVKLYESPFKCQPRSQKFGSGISKPKSPVSPTVCHPSSTERVSPFSKRVPFIPFRKREQQKALSKTRKFLFALSSAKKPNRFMRQTKNKIIRKIQPHS